MDVAPSHPVLSSKRYVHIAVGLFAVFATFILGERFGTYSGAHAANQDQVRRTYPKFLWAFDEWDRCNKGQANYRDRGYLTVEQCDMAVNELAKKQGLNVAHALQQYHSTISL